MKKTPAVSAYLASIGSKGGKIGGKSTSPAKRKAARENAKRPRGKRK